MFQFFHKRSLWEKLFGFNSFLLSLMLIAATFAFLFSYFKAQEVRGRMSHLAHRIIPLSNMAANIDAHSLQQEVHLERIFRLYEIPPRDLETIQKEKTKFEELGVQVDQEIAEAQKMLADALAAHDELLVPEAIEFGKVSPRLSNIEKEHQEFQDHAVEILKMLEAGQIVRARTEESRLEQEADHLDQELEAMLVVLERFAQRQAEQVEQAENRSLLAFLQSFLMKVVVFLVGVIALGFMTTRLVQPVRELIDQSREVTKGNLDVHVRPRSGDEIGQLAHTFNAMTEELRQKEMIKETFGKYVDPRIVDSVLNNQEAQTAFEGEKRVMTVFFSDVQGFSSISESLTPVGLVTLINRYFSLMSEPITAEKGVIDKYIGDAVMAFWGPPFTGEDDHARRACTAALQQFELLRKLNTELPELLGFRKGLPEVNIRIGLSTGELLAGNIGSENSRSFTVMGDTVNVAARLESANKQYGTRLMISEETAEMVKDEFELRELDNIVVVGKQLPVRVFQLLEHKGKLEPRAAELRDEYQAGLDAYRRQDWSKAGRHWRDCLELNAEDGPAKVMSRRLEVLKTETLPADWDGVWRLRKK